jgi:hypothetical protein
MQRDARKMKKNAWGGGGGKNVSDCLAGYQPAGFKKFVSICDFFRPF